MSATPRARSSWSQSLHWLVNVTVLGLLGGVMYLGHQSSWKMPAFSQIRGASSYSNDWCPEHSVPETQCIECQPELYPKSALTGFCREHGVAECVQHHPELAQVQGQPQLPRYDTLEAIRLAPRATNNSRNTLHTRRIQFATPESVEKSGIDVDVVQERSMTEFVEAPGELTFDPTRIAHLSSRVPGSVAAVYRTMGDPVRAGEILALVDAAQVGQAKSQFLQAVVQMKLKQATMERLLEATTSGAVPQKMLLDAEAALEEANVALVSARQALCNLGFEIPVGLERQNVRSVSDDLRCLGIPEYLQETPLLASGTANLIPLRAPHNGVVVAAEVVVGEVVDANRLLFTIADPKQLWLLLQVRQEDAPLIHPGLPVRFTTDDRNREVMGTAAWISPAIDENTRTLEVRVLINNADGSLRDNTYGSARIILREEPFAVTVPREAVQTTNDAQFIFVRDKNFFEPSAPKVFHVRQVRVGARDGQFVELLAGALPGEVIATRGSPALLAQLLRSSFGAGCGCHEP